MIDRKINLILLSIWWGAFTFYAGIVIPLGMKVLGGHTEMGFITQQVTGYLNYLSLLIFVFTAYIFRGEKRFFIAILLLILLQLLLFFVHFELDKLLDFEQRIVLNKVAFYTLHRVYLLISTVIWLIVSGLVFAKLKIF